VFRLGRFPLNPKRYRERGVLLDEPIRSPYSSKLGLDMGVGVPTDVSERQYFQLEYGSQRELFRGQGRQRIRKLER